MRNDTSLLEQILYNRGFNNIKDIQHYLTVDDNDLIDPSMLDHIKDGVIMLIKHIHQNDNAILLIDADTDGYTSAAILLNYLNRLFPSWIQNHVIYETHSDKSHGLKDQDIQNYIDRKIKLVLIPDASSNDYEEHQWLKEHDIDCLILDHHEADEGYSRYACVINNQLSTNYLNKSFCGAGIAYKFCCYIDKIMNTNYAIDYEDLAALGNIADMMDTKTFETHYIIKDGLQRIRNPFFVEMMNRQKYQFEGGITPIGIAFYIVPYINAMTRTGTMEEKMLMFEAMLEWKSDLMVPSTKRGCKGQIEPLHEQAGRTCINVKSRQKKEQEKNLENIEHLIEEQHLLDNKILIIRVPEDEVDKNLAGLIANQLAAKYARPTLVLRIISREIEAEDDEGNLIIKTITTYAGSGRNYSKSRLESFRDFCNQTGLVNYAQGHKSAFGIAISDYNFDKFVEKTNQQLKDFDFTPCYFVDLEVTAEQFTDQEVFTIGSNADLWGQGMDEPLIAITNIKIDSDGINYMGQNKDTLRLTFPGRKTSMIKFRIKDEEKELLDPQGGTLTLTAIGKCSLNHYNGNVTPQILLEDFEITKRTQWDF